MSQSHSRTIRRLIISAAALGLAASAFAQDSAATQAPGNTTAERIPAGAGKVTTSQLKGTVVSVGPGDTLIAKMSPGGEERVFTVAPGKKFLIDGQEKTLQQLQPGTQLTADVTTTETPVVDRTTTVTKGKLLWSSPSSIIVELPSGEAKQYAVKPDFRFDVGDQKLTATQLKRGMELTGTKVVEEPTITITQEATVTGTAPR